ncbi:hypothetical protein [Blastopirellula marina]|uniref:Uncharacterized protein n=1 Tax=Blastopirellula marina TaxID=124 RepID=A0A2S8FWB4_9BACT|nr:hypothetical protein [Blastopirellula marina]PQO36458.1 hypothetical protein C5Y98_12205 [Blastopirellula marina]PTL44295.1 hypothetical protein C5Y97_12215 [Blastopirellula marina]
MQQLNSLIGDLKDIRRIGFDKRLPAPRDEKFAQLADLYLSSNADDRAEIRAALPDDCRLLVIGFSSRMAILAERFADRSYLLRAFAAHSIEDFQWDGRENILRLVLVCHVAKEMGEEPLALLEEMAIISSEGGAKAFRSFASRPDNLNTLQSIEVVKIETPEGVDYVHRP